MRREGELHFEDYCVPSPGSEGQQQQQRKKKKQQNAERQKQPMLSAGVVLVGGVGLLEDALFFVFHFFS